MLECKGNRKGDPLRPTDIPDLRLDFFCPYSPLCNLCLFVKTSNRMVVVQFGEDPSFGMTNPLGVISSGSEKSFSTRKQTMILIEPLPIASSTLKLLNFVHRP